MSIGEAVRADPALTRHETATSNTCHWGSIRENRSVRTETDGCCCHSSFCIKRKEAYLRANSSFFSANAMRAGRAIGLGGLRLLGLAVD